MTQYTHILAKKLNQDSDQEFNAHGLEENGSYIYLHGKLEDMNGYDIVTFLKGNNPSKAGIYPAKVYLDSVTIVYSTLFLWKSMFGNRNGFHGLIVMNGDDANMEYAKEKYDNEETSI